VIELSARPPAGQPHQHPVYKHYKNHKHLPCQYPRNLPEPHALFVLGRICVHEWCAGRLDCSCEVLMLMLCLHTLHLSPIAESTTRTVLLCSEPSYMRRAIQKYCIVRPDLRAIAS